MTIPREDREKSGNQKKTTKKKLIILRRKKKIVAGENRSGILKKRRFICAVGGRSKRVEGDGGSSIWKGVEKFRKERGSQKKLRS